MRASFAEVAANRVSLGVQMSVMIANDVVWLVFWGFYFRVAPTVNDWSYRDVVLLQAVLTTAGGISLGLLGNARNIGAQALDGRLDAVLGLPIHPLPHLIARKVDAVFLGDLAFGLLLFLVAGRPTPARAVWFIACVALSATLITSFMVLGSSTAFFTGRDEGGELSFHGLILFSSYPIDLVAGSAKFLLYSVVPAAFVASVPVRLIDDPDVGRFAVMAAVTMAFVALAFAVFTRGLRHYTSGSAWTRA